MFSLGFIFPSSFHLTLLTNANSSSHPTHPREQADALRSVAFAKEKTKEEARKGKKKKDKTTEGGAKMDEVEARMREKLEQGAKASELDKKREARFGDADKLRRKVEVDRVTDFKQAEARRVEAKERE